MTEKELVSKIKTLKRIQADRKWASMTKTQIMGEPELSFFPNWLPKSRNFLFAPALITILIAVIFIYNRNVIQPQLVALDPQTLTALTTGLRTVETDILKVSVDLGKVKEPQKVLDIKETVNSTLENGQKIVENFKKVVGEQEPTQSLTALGRVEDALEGMEQTYVEKQKEIANQLIQELEKETLTQNQKLALDQAKIEYNNGNFDKALLKAIEASQVQNQ